MAVPFIIPEDQNEVEVILIQLQTLISRLQVAVHNRNQLAQQQAASSSSIPSSTRVRTSSNRLRHRERHDSIETHSQSAPSVLPDLLTRLQWLAASPDESASSQSILTAFSAQRSPRRRTSSESNPDETKISITAIVDYCAQDFNKIDCVENKRSELRKDSLLSKIVPGSMSSLMTAMICFVGWHIFRAR